MEYFGTHAPSPPTTSASTCSAAVRSRPRAFCFVEAALAMIRRSTRRAAPKPSVCARSGFILSLACRMAVSLASSASGRVRRAKLNGVPMWAEIASGSMGRVMRSGSLATPAVNTGSSTASPPAYITASST